VQPPPESEPQAKVDSSGDVGVRLAGCLLAFVIFGVILALPDILGIHPPLIALSLTAIVLGAFCVGGYIAAVRKRWGVSSPDIVQMVGQDLSVVRRRSLKDYRLRLGPEWALRERVVHELLYAIKWVGHLLIVAGLGSLMYRLFLVIGIVHQ
jgi:hypothetical protein